MERDSARPNADWGRNTVVVLIDSDGRGRAWIEGVPVPVETTVSYGEPDEPEGTIRRVEISVGFARATWLRRRRDPERETVARIVDPDADRIALAEARARRRSSR